MPTSVENLLIFALIPIVIAVTVCAGVYMFRTTNREQHRLLMAQECFNGCPTAVVYPHLWRIGAEEIRSLAAQRGYREARSGDPHALVFQFDPRWTPDATPPRLSRRRRRNRRQFLETLTVDQVVWAKPSALAWTRHEITAKAGAQGYAVARLLGDRTDPTMLLVRSPIRSLRDVAPAPAKRPSSWSFTLALGLGVGLITIVAAFAIPKSHSWLWGATAVAAIGAAVLIAVIYNSGGFSARAGHLLREFDGRPQVRLLSTAYMDDSLAINDIAAECGYRYFRSEKSYFHWAFDSTSWLCYHLVHPVPSPGQPPALEARSNHRRRQ
jgi:hypothetical protein